MYLNHERYISSGVCMLLLQYIGFSYYMRYTLFHGIKSKFNDTGRGRINAKRNKMIAIYTLLKPYSCHDHILQRIQVGSILNGLLSDLKCGYVVQYTLTSFLRAPFVKKWRGAVAR